MYDSLQIMRMAHGLAKHASGRQDVVSRNIANADTPDYRAQDLKPFSEVYDSGRSVGLRTTRERHLDAGESVQRASMIEVPGESSPNGNTVSLEGEMMRSADVRHQHDLAMSIYKSSLTILRASLGRR